MAAAVEIFLLEHVHELPSGGTDRKTIGVFRTHAEAQSAQRLLGSLPGFSNEPGGFHEKILLVLDGDIDGDTIYLVYEVMEDEEFEDWETAEIIGAAASLSAAQRISAPKAQDPGFQRLEVFPADLGEIGWREGFATIMPTEQ
jgi:hypothetical protein